MSTNVTTFIASLDSGILQKKLGKILSDVAGSVSDHEKMGEVSLNMKIKPLSGGQVMVEHVVKYKRPTSKGSISEDNLTKTPMHVGLKGDLSLMPENQPDMFEDHENVTALGDKDVAHG